VTPVRALRVGILLVGVVGVCPVRAAVRVTCRTVDGDDVHGVITIADAEGITVSADGQPQVLRYPDLMRIDFPDAESFIASDDPSLRPIHLADGGFVRARLIGSDRRGLRLLVPELGDKPRLFSFASLAGLRVAATSRTQADAVFQRILLDREPGHDVVVVVKDDEVHTFKGSVESLTPEGGRFLHATRELPLNLATLYGVVFASAPPETGGGMMTLELNTGERVTGRITQADPRRFTFTLPGEGEPVNLPWLNVGRIVIRSQRVAYLSDLEPSTVEHEPFFNVSWPMRRDRSASNRPIRLGGETYAKGLGVHSATTVTYTLGGRYSQFAAVIGLDDAVRPRGNVQFRILADGNERYQSGDVTGQDKPIPMRIDIAGVNELRLIVDFGKDADLGDHADWADARVIQ